MANTEAPAARVDGLALEREARALVALGPRVLAELLAEQLNAGAAGFAERIAGYAGLDPWIVRAVGGDRFPPRLFVVPQCAIRRGAGVAAPGAGRVR